MSINESVVAFGPDKSLIGILSACEAPAPSRIGCLLLNTGVNHRVGPRRLNVKTARQLAASGIPCLRFDLSGIGDSAASGGRDDYHHQQLTDMHAALDHFQATTGLSRFIVFGLCSGAVNALNLALADPRIVGVLMFDGYIFPTKTVRLKRKLRRWVAFPFNAAIRRGYPLWCDWTEWLGAPLNADARERFLANLRPGAAGREKQTDIFAADAPTYTAAQFATDLQALVDRDVDISVMFSAMVNISDSNMDLLAQLRGRHCLEHIRYRFWPDIDHTVTLVESQKKLLGAIEQWATDVANRIQPRAAAAPPAPAQRAKHALREQISA